MRLNRYLFLILFASLLLSPSVASQTSSCTFATLQSVKEIEAVYQLHRNVRTTEKDNAPSGFVANDEEACQSNFIKLSVDPKGKAYSVSIPAKSISRTYQVR